MWDKALVVTLIHEFRRCKAAFHTYIFLYEQLLVGVNDQNLKLSCYNAYVDFVAHLYEFYLACIEQDKRYPQKLKWNQIDQIMHIEVDRLLKVRRDRIQRGDAAPWENDISVYEVKLPVEFGSRFRKVRNLRSHVNPERVDFNLGEFYENYHSFVYLLYDELLWLWDVNAETVLNQDWGEIEKFADVITRPIK